MVLSPAAEEKRWKEEADVHTLSEAEIIRRDKKRLSAATKRAKQMANDVRKRADAYETIAKSKKAAAGGKKPASSAKKAAAPNRKTTTKPKPKTSGARRGTATNKRR